MDFKKILNILDYHPPIGGLEISDLNLKFAQIKGEQVVFKTLKIEPGVIKDGKVQDKDKLLALLAELRLQISSGKNKKIYSIINIPDSNAYVQAFNLPQIAANVNFEEAANLNLRMISPIDFESSYSDWQLISEKSDSFELLGAFAQKQSIDELEELLKKSGFVSVAFEFSGLSLSRLVINLGENISADKSYILLHIGANGLSFNLIKNGNLYFNHFVSWQSVYEDKREVSFDSFKELILEEVKKMASFYSNHWSGQIENFILMTYGLEDDIVKIISENFPFKIKKLSLKKYKETTPFYYNVLGSALRGKMPRSEDNFISLASIGTEKESREQRIINFIKLWRSIFMSVFVVVIVVFSLADWFLIKTADSLENQKSSTLSQAANDDIQKLQNKALEFNKKIESIGKIYGQRSKWSFLAEKIKNINPDIKISRIYIQSTGSPVMVNASAKDDAEALNFKKSLEADSQFENVNLPLNKINQTSSGVDFTIIFNVKNL